MFFWLNQVEDGQYVEHTGNNNLELSFNMLLNFNFII